jgi:hypothetical protein
MPEPRYRGESWQHSLIRADLEVADSARPERARGRARPSRATRRQAGCAAHHWARTNAEHTEPRPAPADARAASHMARPQPRRTEPIRPRPDRKPIAMTSTTDARPLPLGVRRIDPERVACKHCGTPCDPDAPREPMAVSGRADPRLGVVEARAEAWFGLCAACTDLDAHAARTLDAHPYIQHSIGSPTIGRYRVASAFHALAVMGAKPAEAYTADGLLSLLDRLSVPGASASWYRRFAPVWQDEAARDTATAEPWLHVGTELRTEIRRQYLDHLADRMPPRAVPCPTGGCAWCGIGSVIAKRSAKPWTPHKIMPTGLGGHDAQTRNVHLCPGCESATDAPMQTAVLDLIDPGREMRKHVPYEPELRGVRGWAVSGRIRPNTEPWAHLDLDGLLTLLARRDY